MGLANPTAGVTVNGNTANRKGEYFHWPLSVPNGSAAYPNVSVASQYGGTQTDSGKVFVPATPETFQHDLDGNLTSDGRWTYTWDGENRLIEMKRDVDAPTGARQRLLFEYDHQGRRIRKQYFTYSSGWQEQSDIVFLYDGWNVMGELNANASNAKLRTYVWGLDLSGTPQGAGGVGGLLMVVDYTSGTTYHNVANDGNGNVSALANASSGAITARYDYGPFGEPTRTTGTLAEKNPFRFSTKYTDQESGLVYFGYRVYRPDAGRWLNLDPLGEVGFELLRRGSWRTDDRAGNLYGFVGNSPIATIDYLGLDYELVNASPATGVWQVLLLEVEYDGSLIAGFRSRYIPSNGKAFGGQPACDCEIRNIFIAQAIEDPYYKPRFDAWPANELPPPHRADDPILPFRRCPGPLTIEDAPHHERSPDWFGTWDIEDCAVCRTKSPGGAVRDKVLGCIRFKFKIDANGIRSLSLDDAINLASQPTDLWEEAYANWQATGSK